ncbi:hypothetical protein E4U53_005299 [Claviceps sorghi]|nr:hypothetical protein E4U53_005299 [Claviceps sorghi]
MHFLTSLLSLGGLALASPAVAPGGNGYPPTSTSKGFHLVVNVTDLSRDLSPSVHGTYISSFHVGPGQSLLNMNMDEKHARIFYVNGTGLDVLRGGTSVLSDDATPPTPYGISSGDIANAVYLTGGGGSKGIGLSHFPVPYTYLLPETYAVCEESIPYYHGMKRLIVKQFQLGTPKLKDVPSGCVPVRLLPQCTPLNKLPADSYSSHEWALDSPCYDKVAGIDWTKSPPL